MPKSLISIRDFSKEEILHILSVAREMEAAGSQNLLVLETMRIWQRGLGRSLETGGEYLSFGGGVDGQKCAILCQCHVGG